MQEKKRFRGEVGKLPRNPNARQLLRFNIRQLRWDRDMDQEQLARRCKVQPLAVRRWEAGTRWPTAESLDAIAKAFGMAVSDLFVRP